MLDAPKAAGGKSSDLRRGDRGRHVVRYGFFTRYEGKE